MKKAVINKCKKGIPIHSSETSYIFEKLYMLSKDEMKKKTKRTDRQPT